MLVLVVPSPKIRAVAAHDVGSQAVGLALPYGFRSHCEYVCPVSALAFSVVHVCVLGDGGTPLHSTGTCARPRYNRCVHTIQPVHEGINS
jgi:hypothetical protein